MTPHQTLSELFANCFMYNIKFLSCELHLVIEAVDHFQKSTYYHPIDSQLNGWKIIYLRATKTTKP